MTEEIFKIILDLIMNEGEANGILSDEDDNKLVKWADETSRTFGYNDWIEAFHFKKPPQQKEDNHEIYKQKT